MTGEGPSELVVFTAPAGDWQHPTPWAGLAVGAALFLAVALLARRRADRPDVRPASRPRRIVEAAFAWALSYTAMRAPGMIELGLIAFGPFAAFELAAGALLFMITAGLLIGTADLLLDALAPRRTFVWLIAGPLLLASFAIGLLAATGWMDIVSAAPGWREAMLLAGVLIAGLSWWSRLPAADRQMAGIFD